MRGRLTYAGGEWIDGRLSERSGRLVWDAADGDHVVVRTQDGEMHALAGGVSAGFGDELDPAWLQGASWIDAGMFAQLQQLRAERVAMEREMKAAQERALAEFQREQQQLQQARARERADAERREASARRSAMFEAVARGIVDVTQQAANAYVQQSQNQMLAQQAQTQASQQRQQQAELQRRQAELQRRQAELMRGFQQMSVGSERMSAAAAPTSAGAASSGSALGSDAGSRASASQDESDPGGLRVLNERVARCRELIQARWSLERQESECVGNHPDVDNGIRGLRAAEAQCAAQWRPRIIAADEAHRSECPDTGPSGARGNL
ncbi:MAG: hypothetical protein NVV60_11120 [Luteimonas sp.]|nr:hypothetical protein [Luteimonas sp.]